MQQEKMWSLVLLIALAVPSCLAYSSGAPIEACFALAPKHNNTAPQTTASPFKIFAWQPPHQPSSAIRVTIYGSVQGFGGFILQARAVDTNAPVGYFNASSIVSGQPVQLGPCMTADGQFSSVTHTNPDPKNILTFMWFAGDTDSSSVYFQGAFAIDHDTYWTAVKSSNFKLRV